MPSGGDGVRIRSSTGAAFKASLAIRPSNRPSKIDAPDLYADCSIRSGYPKSSSAAASSSPARPRTLPRTPVAATAAPCARSRRFGRVLRGTRIDCRNRCGYQSLSRTCRRCHPHCVCPMASSACPHTGRPRDALHANGPRTPCATAARAPAAQQQQHVGVRAPCACRPRPRPAVGHRTCAGWCRPGSRCDQPCQP